MKEKDNTARFKRARKAQRQCQKELLEARREYWAVGRKVQRLMDRYSKARMRTQEIVFGTNFRDGKDDLSK